MGLGGFKSDRAVNGEASGNNRDLIRKIPWIRGHGAGIHRRYP